MHISLGRARYSISRACTNASGKAYRFEEDGVPRDEGEEGKRSHDFLGREVTQLSRTRGDIVPKCRTALRCSCRSYSSIGSRDLLVLLPCPPLTEGGESRLFFSLNSVDRPSASPPSPLGRKDSLETSITEERRLERVFVKRRTANQSSSTNVLPRRTKEKKVSTTITTTIVVHHRSFHLSFNRQRGTPPPPPRFYGVFEGQSRRESSRQRKKRR